MLKFMEINQIVFTKTKEVYYKNEDTTLEETKLGGEKMTKSEMIEKLVKDITDGLRNITMHELPEGKEYDIYEYNRRKENR